VLDADAGGESRSEDIAVHAGDFFCRTQRIQIRKFSG
jgi:hypothetical protein